MKNNGTFRMYTGIKFNRPIIKEKDHISIGGFRFVMGNEIIEFDLDEYAGKINEKDGSILDVVQKNPAYDTFPDLEKVSEEMLSNVTEIQEFSVYTGEPGESDLEPISLVYCTFVLPYQDWKMIEVKSEVLKNATFNVN